MSTSDKNQLIKNLLSSINCVKDDTDDKKQKKSLLHQTTISCFDESLSDKSRQVEKCLTEEPTFCVQKLVNWNHFP